MVQDDFVRQVMLDAIELAIAHRPHPNPRVGAVVLDPSGTRVGVGAHVSAGTPHAEVIALEQAGRQANGGTLVVTLEPHDHHGRTPPCTEAVIRAGIRRVVVGAIDPDPRVRGRGVERLRAAGIEVETGVEADAVEHADPGYFHHRTTGRARVILKTASTLDGQTAAMDGSSQWITGEMARSDAHLLRGSVDAVMVGAGTVLADDPLLSVRVGSIPRQPRPVIVAGRRRLPADLRLWGRDPIVASPIPLRDVDNLIIAPGKTGRVDLAELLRTLPEHGILDVLVEGGPGLAGSLWEAGLVDAGVSFLASMVAGGVGGPMFDREFPTLHAARPVDITGVKQIGDDVRIDWTPRD